MFKVIIAGGRNFQDYDLVRSKCDTILSGKTDIEIVSGRCSGGVLTFTTKDGVEVYGADGLGERYAEDRLYPVAPFPADWASYGNHAGPIRNKLMAEYANCLIAFWDGRSRGTKSMIELAKIHKLPTRVINYF